MFEIRPYRTADSDAVIAIWRAASNQAHSFLSEAFVEKAGAEIRDIYLPMAETYVAEVNGTPRGFIALIGNEVGGFFMDPESQGQGMGRALMDVAVSKPNRLELDVFVENPIGRRFYMAYGFVQGDERADEASGFPVLRMTLDPAKS
ncbi:MAG: GNAT family N-acetyltransferase [Shimia sp.]|jgi:putative acetyltransferase|uniref:GNAT family N-acetyltransferase n=1 Tax=Shimia sp. TaxID=1954381 RepID=UPI004059008E